MTITDYNPKVIKRPDGCYFIGFLFGIPSWNKDKMKAKEYMRSKFPKYTSTDILRMLKPRKNKLKLVI